MKFPRNFFLGTAAALAVLATHSLIADDAHPRLKGGFGAPAPDTSATAPRVAIVATSGPVSATVVPAGTAASVVTAENKTVVAAEKTERSCLVRDPEDGACYASADAADQAWLAKGPVSTLAILPAPDGDDDDPDDEVEDDSEDGGSLAPVDAPHIDTVTAPEKKGFWRDLASRLTRLVVRKADSRPASIPEEELAALFDANFPLPLEQFPEEKLRDSFDAPRGAHRRHHAIDLPAPRGTPVVAVVDGVVDRIGRDRRGGKVTYLRDKSGRFTFYYAHLSQHEKGLRPGDKVKKGQRLGYVGATGHASGPHLHFAIFRQDGEPMPTKGLVVNPYLVFTSILSR